MLVKALGCLEPGIISFVGGGGKTSAISRLAFELNRMGEKVIVTTTTQLAATEGLAYEHRLIMAEHDFKIDSLPDQDLLLLGLILDQNKLEGIGPAEVEQVHSLAPERYILVEADGAAKKPFTAPADYEPVIPATTQLVVALVGAWALGLPLSSEYLHRPELISHITGLVMGECLTVEGAGRAILHPKGYQKGVPTGAKFAVLINGVQAANEDKARKLGFYLRKAGVEKVLLTNVREESPVQEVL